MGKHNLKPRGKYQAVSISKDFIKEVKKYVLENPRYRSIADFTKEAVREKMERLDNCPEKIKFCPYCGKPLT